MLRPLLCFVLPASLLTAFVVRPAMAEQEPVKLVTIVKGELPIILSAPHGGSYAIPNVPARSGKGVDSFVKLSDFNTATLTELLADEIESKLGGRPYVVIARSHRKYLDVNRRPRNAYESQLAKTTYDTYHAAVTDARRNVVKHFGYGLLLDVHGQSSEPTAIIRGTQNGETTTHLLSRFGDESLRGKTSLFGRLAEQGFTVIPAVDSKNREHDRYGGGYIVRTYGSSSSGTVDAIQLEVGRELRSREATAKTAAMLASAITKYAAEYLPQPRQHERLTAGRPDNGKVSVGVYCDKGAGNSLNDLLTTLEKFEDVSVHKLVADDIRSGALADVDVIIHPGGSGSAQARQLGEDGRRETRQFIRDGGGFIGICAGAYLASADYTWSLNVLDAKVLDRKHWARGTGMVEISLTDAGQRVLHSHEQQLTIFYGQGPLLAPKENDDIVDYETLATYKTEIAKNGAPEGVMKGTTALAKGRFGRGCVFCFSPHPEKTKGLGTLVHHAIDHVKRTRAAEQPSSNE